MSETSEVVTPLLDLLQRCGLWAMRVQSGEVKVRGGWMRLAPEGTPDIIGYLPTGRMFAIECKTDEGEAFEAQLAWAQRARANGVLHIFAHGRGAQQKVIDFIIAPLARRVG